MIKANELRIGNWVIYHGETDMPCQLDAQDIFNISIGYGENDKIHSPIPLTPEVLEKCGFEKIVNRIMTYYHIGENEITKDWLFVIKWVHTYSTPFFQNGKHELKHLHQLQNLYFALTGEELEYKP